MRDLSRTELYYLLALVGEDIQNMQHSQSLRPIAPELIVDVRNDTAMALGLQAKLQEMFEEI